MFWKRLFATKSLEMLHNEMESDNRLRRVLGPIGLTSLGVGAIIGAGIFVITGRVAAQDAGPAIIMSFCVAGVACALAAMCYAEFASMAPVAGSAYTYAYATLGELFAWIIGWDLVLEYALSAATVASAWSEYLNKFLEVCFGKDYRIPDFLCNDPFSKTGAWFNLPAVAILAIVTSILVIGIRESAISNTVMVVVKLAVVLFVIAVGVWYVNPANWTEIPQSERKLPEDWLIPDYAEKYTTIEEKLLKTAEEYAVFHGSTEVASVTVQPKEGPAEVVHPSIEKDKKKLAEIREKRTERLKKQAIATFRMQMAHELASPEQAKKVEEKYSDDLPKTTQEKLVVKGLLAEVSKEAPKKITQKWGLLGYLGLDRSLAQIDDATRSNFMPFGVSGMMLGAALVFFAFIGFDSISTHSEEAVKPQRDVPFGIIASLVLCTVLYIAVAGIITGMERYPDIDPKAAVAAAFDRQAHVTNNPMLSFSAALIALGALAGMTSVLLITFLSQARIFLAMARDGLVPHAVFGVVHPKFKTPHISTMLTGGIMAAVAALTPIGVLEEMVNIGTLFAFVVVCAAVLILRIKRPEARRPFHCPLVFLVAPLGILVNVILMLFLPIDTWGRLVVWLIIGLTIYFTFGWRNSVMGKRERGEALPSSYTMGNPEKETTFKALDMGH